MCKRVHQYNTTMSYLQIEIGPERGDPPSRLRGLKFNQYACIIVQEKTDPLHPGASANVAVIYGGLMGNCYVKGEAPDFTFADVMDWIEELSEDVILAVFKAYVSSTTWKKQNPDSTALVEIEAVENKKKELLAQTSTEPSASGLAAES